MKLFGKILAALIAGVITVIAVQQFIKRMYVGFGKKYFSLPGEENEQISEETVGE